MSTLDASGLRIAVGLLTVPPGDLLADASRPLLLLLHGRGANERDLAKYVSALPSRYAFGLLRAPLPFGEDGYSWFTSSDSSANLPASASAKAVEGWLADKGLDTPEREISLLGFSGGAVVSLELLRRRPARYSAVVGLSGYVESLDGEIPSTLSDRVRPRVFWGHADVDAVIGDLNVEKTRAWLQANTELSERIYPGIAHSISDEEIADVHGFLEHPHAKS